MTPHILVVGGGYVGMYTAYTLQRKLRPGEARVSVVDPRSAMTYQPFLPEAAAGSLEPRHVVVSLRRVLDGCHVISGRISRIEHARRVATIAPVEGEPYEIGYDTLVVALGSVARTLPIPGLAETAIGFKQIEEAITLRNQVLERLDVASSARDQTARRRALSFVFVGGGYAGVEALAELEDMACYAADRYYDNVAPGDMRWVLVEASDRILPEVGPALGRYTVDRLVERGIDVRLNTRLESCIDGRVVLSDGESFDADTVVWTAGVRANPVLAASDLPLDDKGRVRTRPNLAVEGRKNAWAAGDNAAVPDLANPGQLCSPSAQHAVRQARRLADNLVRELRGQPIVDYRHKHVGSVASLGLHKGVAQVYGIKLRGWPAWFMHRTYHMSRLPTLNKKLRVVSDWTLALFFRRDIVSLGELEHPRAEFERAAR